MHRSQFAILISESSATRTLIKIFIRAKTSQYITSADFVSAERIEISLELLSVQSWKKGLRIYCGFPALAIRSLKYLSREFGLSKSLSLIK